MGNQSSGDYFIGMGFKNLKGKNTFRIHVGGPNGTYKQTWRRCQDLMN